jgi:hypothetical protein
MNRRFGRRSGGLSPHTTSRLRRQNCGCEPLSRSSTPSGATSTTRTTAEAMTRSLHDGLIQRALDRIRAGDKADAAPAPSSSTGSNWSSAIRGTEAVSNGSLPRRRRCGGQRQGRAHVPPAQRVVPALPIPACLGAAKRSRATDGSELANDHRQADQGGAEAARVGALPACAARQAPLSNRPKGRERGTAHHQIPRSAHPKCARSGRRRVHEWRRARGEAERSWQERCSITSNVVAARMPE